MSHTSFAELNCAYGRTFKPGRLSLGLVVPLERYDQSAVPSMNHHIQRAQLADTLGFSALWLRDVPFNVPSFGDAGQVFDPFVYLGVLSAQTQTIALGVASIILPLRHPAHVAKAAASVDALSNGRLLLGAASGDRPEEYPAMNMRFDNRGERFRDSVEYIRQMEQEFPVFQTTYGVSNGDVDMLPKPSAKHLPLLITGGSQQSPQWVAEHGDGWMTYPRPLHIQSRIISAYRRKVRSAGMADKPVMQSLYIDLIENDEAPAEPIHLGFRSGINALQSHLIDLEQIGVNHVALNLRFNQDDIETTMKRLADTVLPAFSN